MKKNDDVARRKFFLISTGRGRETKRVVDAICPIPVFVLVNVHQTSDCLYVRLLVLHESAAFVHFSCFVRHDVQKLWLSLLVNTTTSSLVEG